MLHLLYAALAWFFAFLVHPEGQAVLTELADEFAKLHQAEEAKASDTLLQQAEKQAEKFVTTVTGIPMTPSTPTPPTPAQSATDGYGLPRTPDGNIDFARLTPQQRRNLPGSAGAQE